MSHQKCLYIVVDCKRDIKSRIRYFSKIGANLVICTTILLFDYGIPRSVYNKNLEVLTKTKQTCYFKLLIFLYNIKPNNKYKCFKTKTNCIF